MGEWQPIITWPYQHEVEVIAYDPNHGRLIAFFSSGHGWCSKDKKTHPRIEPTHWMPLPPAPTPEKVREGGTDRRANGTSFDDFGAEITTPS